MVNNQPQAVKVAELVLDFSVYPRASVDDQHISRLAEALRAGETFPPLIADRKSRRIVDGFHRSKAYLRVAGEDATCRVQWRDYADDNALFLDAARLNARHGLRVSRLDEAHCMAVAMRLGVDQSELAAVLALTAEKYEQMRASRFATTEDGEPVVLKRSTKHLAGTRITKAQLNGNAKSSGWRLDFHMDQIVNALENDLIDFEDEMFVVKLRYLFEVLERTLAAKAD